MQIEKQLNCILECLKLMDTLYEEYAKSFGLTEVSMSVLEVLFDHSEGCTQKFITEELRCTKQNLYKIIKSFYEKGYISMEEIPENRSLKRVKLTEEGIEFAKKVIEPYWSETIRAFQTIPEQERNIMINGLVKFKKEILTSYQNYKIRIDD